MKPYDHSRFCTALRLTIADSFQTALPLDHNLAPSRRDAIVALITAHVDQLLPDFFPDHPRNTDPDPIKAQRS